MVEPDLSDSAESDKVESVVHRQLRVGVEGSNLIGKAVVVMKLVVVTHPVRSNPTLCAARTTLQVQERAVGGA